MSEEADFSRAGATASGAELDSSDATPRLAPGTFLRGTYHIVRRLSQGGMGEVYEATHARLPGRYAVKVLRGDLSQDMEATLRFRREAEITSRLRHPGIVNVVDFDATDEGEPYLVMEFLEGEDLAKRLARPEPRPRWWIADVVSQIGAALGAAHAQGVVHRDLKPQNVFLVPTEGARHRVKVVDFGISKMHALSLRLTRESTLLGTPPYMSPEQAVGRADDVDARADQFALATLTYELVTGHRPFDGENVMALFYQIVNVAPPPMGTWVPSVPAALEAIVRKGLAKSREARFPSIEAFAAAFAEAVAAAGPEAEVAAGQGTWAAKGKGLLAALPPRKAKRRSARVAVGLVAGLGVAAAAWQFLPLAELRLSGGPSRATELGATASGLPSTLPPSVGSRAGANGPSDNAAARNAVPANAVPANANTANAVPVNANPDHETSVEARPIAVSSSQRPHANSRVVRAKSQRARAAAAASAPTELPPPVPQVHRGGTIFRDL